MGDVLASKYRLDALLGSGGMGHVYRAVNIEIGREVAIKVLRAEHATNGDLVERFLREARAANLVRHPNVVDVVDIGRDGDGSPFIVQELLEGEDLGAYVERSGGRLTLNEVEDYLVPVVDAVAEAHARGVVHRDIKPENVFLARVGARRVPKLLDFGISKVRLPNIKATEVGVMMGTPAYMAPEQVRGARDADPRADVWALGVMLFELVAGRLPFEAEDAPALFVAIATQQAPPLAEVAVGVDAHVSRVVERCLRRSPDERYPTALELARDLRRALEGEAPEGTQTRSIAPARVVTPPPSSNDVPDLILPAKPASQRSVRSIATKVAPVSAGAVPELPVQPATIAHRLPAAPTPAPAPTPLAPAEATGRAAIHAAALPSERAAPDRPLSGVMLAGSTPSQRRPIANAYLSEPSRQEAPPPDMTFLVALAVVGLTSIGATAVLMTFAYQPEGWPLVALVATPTPQLNLLVHAGLGGIALLVAARLAAVAVKKWRGFADGGRGGAIVSAIVAGGFFFAALQLARAAW